MSSTWFQVIFGITAIYFGAQALRILPALVRLVVALLTRTVRWPGPRVHDPDQSASVVRERLGVGYQNLFPAFFGNVLGGVGGFVFCLLTFLSSTPLLGGYVPHLAARDLCSRLSISPCPDRLLSPTR